jgi:hypothetical protein
MITKYADYYLNKYDSQGNKIYYSVGKESYTLKNGTNDIKLYNGRWYLYDTVFVASGTQYETFILDNVVSNSDLKQYAAHGFIDVYVKRNNVFKHFQGLTDEIFSNNLKSYDSDNTTEGISIFKATDEDLYFSIRLNENKCYEIKFGNGTNGQKLVEGDQVYVFYMKSNGFDAGLNIGDIKDAKFIEPAGLVGVTQDMFYLNLLEISDHNMRDQIIALINNIGDITNTSSTTSAMAEESVEDIR